MAPTTENVRLNRGLTDYMRGFKWGHSIVDEMFPPVRTNSLSGEFWDDSSVFAPIEENDGPASLDSEYLYYEYEIGKKLFEIGNYGFATKMINLEMADQDRMLQILQRKLRQGRRFLTIQKEIRGKNIAMKSDQPNSIDVSATEWTSDDNDPYDHVTDAKKKVYDSCGIVANAMALSMDAVFILMKNKALKDRKNGSNSIQNPVMLADIALQFDIKPECIYVGGMVYNKAKKGQDVSKGRVWEASDGVLLFYKDEMGDASDPIEADERTGFGAKFVVENWERLRVTEGPCVNPPGMEYVLQEPYQLQGFYDSSCLIKNIAA